VTTEWSVRLILVNRLDEPGMGLRRTRCWKKRTWPADHGHEQPNSEIWRQAQKVVPTEPRRCGARSGAARAAANTPVLLRGAAGSLWSILVREGNKTGRLSRYVTPREPQSRHANFNPGPRRGTISESIRSFLSLLSSQHRYKHLHQSARKTSVRMTS
jgi:hypothetical protein